LLYTLEFEATSFQGFSYAYASEFHILTLSRHESGHAGEHYFFNSFHFSQGHTGLFSSASSTTAERYGVSFDGRCSVVFSISRGS
jgi:hypothetical protein